MHIYTTSALNDSSTILASLHIPLHDLRVLDSGNNVWQKEDTPNVHIDNKLLIAHSLLDLNGSAMTYASFPIYR